MTTYETPTTAEVIAQINGLLQSAHALITAPSISAADLTLANERRSLANELRLFQRYVYEETAREKKRMPVVEVATLEPKRQRSR